MRLRASDFRVPPRNPVVLAEWPTVVRPLYKSKEDYRAQIADHVAELSAQQDLFYANSSYSLLLIFQAMDAAGKDGAIKHVMSGVNPQGCQVVSFKHPTGEELDHDFLWRATRQLPPRGMIGIFNRSYYEEVLIVRVHPEILSSQNIPSEFVHEDTIWQERYRSIVDLEDHLGRNGTKIIKFFLHLSKNEQRKRFLKRIDNADKNWKINLADMQERKHWQAYMKAYEACLGATNTETAPWYVVPADDKNNARLIVSEVVLGAFRELRLRYPTPTKEQRKQLAAMRKQL
jgi:PPK2 family polyphosphate:nucleotide phosphotransferase